MPDERLGRGQLAQRVRPASHPHQHQAALRQHDAVVGRVNRPLRPGEQCETVVGPPQLGFQVCQGDDEPGGEGPLGPGHAVLVFPPAKRGQPGPHQPGAVGGPPRVSRPQPPAVGLPGAALGLTHAAD